MKIAIRYFTKSKKGNTAKLARCVSEAVGCEASDVSKNLTEKTDRLFLINAMYAGNIDREVRDFLSRNRDKIGEVVNFCTSASGMSTRNALKKATDELGLKLSDKEFCCAASWIFINKGLPSQKDYDAAAQFAREMAH